MPDLIKCPICEAIFNPAYLDQVIEHMHGIDPKVIPLAKIIKGKKVMENKTLNQVISWKEIQRQLLEAGQFTAEFENVLMWIQFFPTSNRGKYLWSAEGKSWKIKIDGNDMFPRYYFLEDSLVNEINAWIEKRKDEIGERKVKDEATNGHAKRKPKDYPIGDE